MDDLRLAAVAARVVAWHNRHPLARRISAAQVHAVGYVGLPFAGAGAGAAAASATLPSPADASAPAGAAAASDGEMVDLGAAEAGSLRERALARARQQAGAADAGAPAAAGPSAAPAGAALGAMGAAGAAPVAAAPPPDLATLRPDFSEDFIDPLRPRAVARFASRAGQVLARPPVDGPVREVSADGAHRGRQPVRVYLLTAVVETGTRKSRVLLGTGLVAPVLGRRILDTPRVAALAGLAGLVIGAPAWVLQPPAGTAPTPPPALPVAGPVAVPAPAPPASTAAEHEPGAAPSPPAIAAVTALAGRAAASAAAPPSTPAEDLAAPSIRPVISDEDKARARQARESLQSSRAAAAAPARPETPPAVALPPALPASVPARPPTPTAAPTRPVSPSAPESAAFALSTRTLRTRAEAEQVQVAMQSLLRTVGAADVKVDVLPQGDDWRVVALPFRQRAAADKARTLLVSRGMRVEVIDF